MKKEPNLIVSIVIIGTMMLLFAMILYSCALVYPKQSLPDETKYQSVKRACEAKPDPCACWDSTMRVPIFKPKHRKISNI